MFLDSNVLIHAYTSKGRDGEICGRMMEGIAKGEQNAVSSPLVFDEVLYYMLNHHGLDFAESAWRKMIATPHLRLLPVDEKVVPHVMKFVKAGLEPRDAFHAATMHANGIDTICSYDKGFDRVPSIRRQVPK